ncbi:MAG: SDR family NAD(P)-dependent oxidoreductase [Cyclobacteriaceae bacterium]|nr:SDR family NAD(P)-dependent oxidoreductase [Cyclobacteriaceae bacterium]
MNKLIVVTGGTKGIGKAIIDKFAAEGFDVFTTSRNQNDLEVLKTEIEAKFQGVSLHFHQADLSVRDQISQCAEAIHALTRPVDVLVNNAGLFVPGAVMDEKEGNLEFMIQTNLYSAYHLTRAILPDMIDRKAGHIFNMCSTASIIPYVNGGSYCISKFALLGMSKVLREELKPHQIRVTAILPGATLTASWEGADIPAERFMKAEDVAEATWAAYKLSDHSVIEEMLIRPQLGDL